MNQIYKQCDPETAETTGKKGHASRKSPVQNLAASEPLIIKSTAGTILKQKIQQESDKRKFMQPHDKYVECSRFCMLQSSSSSSSEKDHGIGHKQKYKQTLVDCDVPEEQALEDQISNGINNREASEIKIQDQEVIKPIEKQESEDLYQNSLFSFDFLSEEKS